MLFTRYCLPGTPSLGVSGVASSAKDGGKESPQKKSKDNILVISGGEGYIDFRQGTQYAQ